jgi:hypothetical protein
MAIDSLIGSTISTRSKKSVSCASKISSPCVISHTKASMVSEKVNPHDLYNKTFNHEFSFKPDFTGHRNNAEKKFKENQNYVGDEEFHQEPNHLNNFTKRSKKEHGQCQL